ncbi:MAG: hypothetical protein AB7O97_16920 [Planctomycetota bacterium]
MSSIRCIALAFVSATALAQAAPDPDVGPGLVRRAAAALELGRGLHLVDGRVHWFPPLDADLTPTARLRAGSDPEAALLAGLVLLTRDAQLLLDQGAWSPDGELKALRRTLAPAVLSDLLRGGLPDRDVSLPAFLESDFYSHLSEWFRQGRERLIADSMTRASIVHSRNQTAACVEGILARYELAALPPDTVSFSAFRKIDRRKFRLDGKPWGTSSIGADGVRLRYRGDRPLTNVVVVAVLEAPILDERAFERPAYTDDDGYALMTILTVLDHLPASGFFVVPELAKGDDLYVLPIARPSANHPAIRVRLYCDQGVSPTRRFEFGRKGRIQASTVGAPATAGLAGDFVARSVDELPAPATGGDATDKD